MRREALKEKMTVISESKWNAKREEVKSGSGRGLARAARLGIAAAAILLCAVLPLRAQDKVLYSFAGPTADGGSPSGSLARDASGNLYGTTQNGGASSAGTVFKMHPNGDGTYTESLLYSFGATSGDGQLPVTGLVMDGSGNLFGTTQSGGTSTNCQFGCGTVFELVNSSGIYTFMQLYSFIGQPDGQAPGGLIIDASGNLYGTTQFGGTAKSATICKTGCGTVFELANNSGSYTYSVLFSFSIAGFYGINPAGGLVIDSSGSLYGTAPSAGHSSACTVPLGCGVVFELVNSSGVYAPSVLYNFAGVPDGELPGSTLIADAQGNLYGTASGGASTTCSSFGCGVVFELHPNGDGSYSESVLYSFTGSPDGQGPGALVMDASGDFYGLTGAGGNSTACIGCGTVFKLHPNGDGSYSESVLYSFTGSPDGAVPTGLVLDVSDNVYGTIGIGGTSTVCSLSGCGTVFEILSGTVQPTFAISATSGSGQTTTVNTAFSAPLVAMVVNGSDTGVSDVTVTFTATAGVGGASGTFAGGVNTAVTDGYGKATSAVFTANGTAGSYSVTATAPNVTGTASFSLMNQAALSGTITTITSAISLPYQGITTATIAVPFALVGSPPVEVKFTVAPQAGSTGTPTGTVTVTDGSGDSCNSSVSVGTCLLTFAQAGTFSLTATYVPDAASSTLFTGSNFIYPTKETVLQIVQCNGFKLTVDDPESFDIDTNVCAANDVNGNPTATVLNCMGNSDCMIKITQPSPGDYQVDLQVIINTKTSAPRLNPPPIAKLWPLTLFWLGSLLTILMMLHLVRRGQVQARRSWTVASLLIVVVLLGALSACSTGPKTPPGSYVVNVQITDGKFNIVVPFPVVVKK
jgi:uncharacterized repeat protein (TIGR03803 family)